MNDSVDKHWYSSEAVRHDRENAERVLNDMKELEKKYSKTREKVIEKTLCGERIKYVKKWNSQKENQ